MIRKYRELPELLRAILFDCDAYLVGSGALWYIDASAKMPKDLDVIVSPDDWNKACRMIGVSGIFDKLNSLGGLKVGGNDIWMSTINEYIKAALGRRRGDNIMMIGINPNCIININ